MNTNTALKLLALVLFLGLGYLLFVVIGGDDGGPVGPAESVGPRGDARSVDLESTAEEAVPDVAAPERIEVPTSGASVGWCGDLAGLVGRVVENDGTPVPEIRVALLEFDTEILFAGIVPDPDAPAPSLELEETLTDEEGRFRLAGARAPAFHGLGIDLGGARSTFRVLDSALAHGKSTDVGDVVLAPFGILSGRIVDEEGAGVAGARIRVGPFPEEVLLSGAWELREESLVAISMLLTTGGGQGVVELPGWVRRLIDDFPIPTTYSDEMGLFRLEGVPLAKVIGGIDRPGLVGIPVGPIDMLASAEQDLGDLILPTGRTIEGIVEDSGGDPVVGVEVFAGAEVPAGFVAILQPCGVTNEEGEFSLAGVREEGQVVAVTRRTKSEPWASEVTTLHDDMILSLESAIELTVLVQDEAGEPRSGALIQLDPAPTGDSMMGFGEALRFLPRDLDPDNGFREVEPGRYVNGTVTPGSYRISAHVEGLARGRVTAEVWDEESEEVVVCPTGTHLEVTVLDGATQKPVEGARARVLTAGMGGFEGLAEGVTDGEGQARLGPLGEVEEGEGDMDFSETMLIVRHSRFADHSAPLEALEGEVVVALEGSGVLAGRVHWDGEIPTRLYMLIVQDRGAEGFAGMFQVPRFGLTDLSGAFRIENLGVGEYGVELVERFLDQDPFSFIGGGFEPATLHKETIEIESGATTELVIDLTPSGRGPTAAIEGRVRFDGRDIEGAEITVRGNGTLRTTTDQWGRFATEAFSVQRKVWVSVEGDIILPSGAMSRMEIFRERLELQEGEVRTLEIDLVPVELRAKVVDGNSGDPVAGAQVHARSTGDRRGMARGFSDGLTTDLAGDVVLWVPDVGEYNLTASAPGFSEAGASVTALVGGSAEVTVLSLPRSVVCAGRVAVPAYATGPRNFSYLWVRSEEGNHSSGTMISGPDFEFDLEDLCAGTYRAHAYINGVEGEVIEFELGPDGDRNLILDYVPQVE
jgi:hypothetical protein